MCYEEFIREKQFNKKFKVEFDCGNYESIKIKKSDEEIFLSENELKNIWNFITKCREKLNKIEEEKLKEK